MIKTGFVPCHGPAPDPVRVLPEPLAVGGCAQALLKRDDLQAVKSQLFIHPHLARFFSRPSSTSTDPMEFRRCFSRLVLGCSGHF